MKLQVVMTVTHTIDVEDQGYEIDGKTEEAIIKEVKESIQDDPYPILDDAPATGINIEVKPVNS